MRLCCVLLLIALPASDAFLQSVQNAVCKDRGYADASDFQCQQYAHQQGVVMHKATYALHNEGCNVVTDCTQFVGGCDTFKNGEVVYVVSDVIYVGAVCEAELPCVCKDPAVDPPPLPPQPDNIHIVLKQTTDTCAEVVSDLVCQQYATSRGLEFQAYDKGPTSGCLLNEGQKFVRFSTKGTHTNCGANETDFDCVCIAPTPAPPTLAPPTAVPTPAPVTPAPLTIAPVTPAPLTSAPPTAVPTLSPPTVAPTTTSPLTLVPTAVPTASPLTPAPVTPAPLTPFPPTLAPTAVPTAAPLTPAPVTLSPPTATPALPPTPSPPTLAPTAVPTAAPATPAPVTPAPPTLAPTAVPTAAPLTPAPLTPFPPTVAPTAVPTAAPQTSIPVTPAPPTLSPTAVPTTIPLTPAPVTPAPTFVPTVAPPTPSPPTLAPTAVPTAAPLTPAPVTLSPPTATPALPPTPSPPTLAPTAVPTPAPVTPAPPTPSPPTLAPTAVPTASPPTPEPVSTLPPPTPSPPTLTPPAVPTPGPTLSPPTPTNPPTLTPTDGPDTALPPSLTTTPPTTGTPATPQPSTFAPPPTGQVIGGAGGGLLTGGAAVASAASAGRMALLAGVEACRLDVEHLEEPEYLPWTLHPLRITVHGSEWVGAVLGNTALCAGASALGWAAVLIVRAVLPRYSEAFQARMDVQGFLRLPSAVLFLFTILYQGTSLASLRMMIAGTEWYYEVVGAVGLLTCIAVPVHLYRQIRACVPTHGRYALDPSQSGAIKNFFLGPGEWVSAEPKFHWVQRYSVVIRPYKQQYAWWVCVEYLAMMLLSGASSARLRGHVKCCALKSTSALILLVLSVASLCVRPYHRPRDNVLGPLINFTQTVSVVMVATGFCKNDSLEFEEWMFRRSEEVLVLSVVLLLLKLLFDATTEVYVFFTGRRVALQHMEYMRQPFDGDTAKSLTDDESIEMLEDTIDCDVVVADADDTCGAGSPSEVPHLDLASFEEVGSGELVMPGPQQGQDANQSTLLSLSEPLLPQSSRGLSSCDGGQSPTASGSVVLLPRKLSSISVRKVYLDGRTDLERFLCNATDGKYQEQVAQRRDSDGNPIARVLL